MSLFVRDLAVAYGERTVLSDLACEVPSGGWLAPIGPNGAGKSSLLKAIAGLVPSSGSLLLDGQSPSACSRRELARLVAYVPQRPELPPAMSVAEYCFLGRTPHLGLLGTERRSDRLAVGEVLERLDLTGLANRPLGTCSGGEAQRAVLARALAQEAPVLLLDEPTAALDLGHAQQVLELVDGLRRERGLTVVSAMHDLTLAGQFAEELLLVDAGRALALGTPARVLTEAVLRPTYGGALRVLTDADGTIVVLVDRRRRPPSAR